MRFLKLRLRRFALAPTLAIAMACAGDTFSPTTANVAGAYTATVFTATTGGLTINLLAAGASLTATLAEGGTVTGHLFVPGGAEGDGNLDADLAGTWTLTGNSVRFTQAADTFVRDVFFVASENRLTGDATFNGTAVHVVLTK
ncbi:MAG TPA: hypothetical protein VGQ17_10330 [Gemmatimonadales bacterium]|jgi:hypothetical protein|nr:hypothetical protein [Gemmatimonadales bacterium]